MPEWLESAVAVDSALSVKELAVRFLLALVLGAAVGGTFRVTVGSKRHDAHALMMTLVLLPVLIAMVSIVIGNNVARAFSLMGTLSIVRFRTVVEDTRDTAFVIFSVVVGMAAGAGLLVVALVGIPCVGLAALVMSRWPRLLGRDPGRPFLLAVRLNPTDEARKAVEALMQERGLSFRLVTAATARQGAAFDLSYRVLIKRDMGIPELIVKFNQVAGLQGVEIREA